MKLSADQPQNLYEISLIIQLLSRLERLSADSKLAHKASGIRGALLRSLENIETGKTIQKSELNQLIKLGFGILEKAALEKIR